MIDFYLVAAALPIALDALLIEQAMVGSPARKPIPALASPELMAERLILIADNK